MWPFGIPKWRAQLCSLSSIRKIFISVYRLISTSIQETLINLLKNIGLFNKNTSKVLRE